MEETFSQNSEGRSKVEIVLKEDWLKENIPDVPKECSRAVLCLEDLVKRELADQQITMIEFGPITSIEDEGHIAPIAIFAERHPDARCVGIGHLPIEGNESNMRNVPYVRELLGLSNDVSNRTSDALQKNLGGRPNVIYGQHVFESSSSFPHSLPVGPYKVFEEAAKILAPGGCIVVDNYGGSLNQVGINRDWPASSKLVHAYTYSYDRGEGIYVYRKGRATSSASARRPDGF